jgi:hypothetical protein
MGFEPTTLVFERVKTFHALDSVANVISATQQAICFHAERLELFD